MDLVEQIGRYAALASVLGLLLLLPLYLSQRRDVQRLRAFMETEPTHPAADMAASETLLDRAEAELEELLGPSVEETPAGATPVPAGGPATAAGEGPATGATPIPPVERVTAERPALDRITMEREAVRPHPRWRQFVARVTRPRVLAIIALSTVVLGVAAVVASEHLLSGPSGGGHERKPGAFDPSQVDVTALNGTAIPGLAAKVGDDVASNGFHLLGTDTTRGQIQQTVVQYAPGDQVAATRVAHALGVKPVQPIDSATRRLAPDADVVVIAGQDRVKP
jgi:hypothetical protein